MDNSGFAFLGQGELKDFGSDCILITMIIILHRSANRLDIFLSSGEQTKKLSASYGSEMQPVKYLDFPSLFEFSPHCPKKINE